MQRQSNTRDDGEPARVLLVASDPRMIADVIAVWNPDLVITETDIAKGDALSKLRQIPTGVLRTEGLEINVVRRRATLGGVDLRLTPVEQSLLYLLASNAGRVLSRDQILDAVWGSRFSADSNLVDRHIRNLRAKLHDDWREPTFILTVNGRGYAFRSTSASQSAV